MTTAANVEELWLSTDDAKRLAEACRASPDPLSEIAPSLLSAEHIKKYVERTGLISPFYLGGGRKERLKKASYEGRIGSKAYTFGKDNGLKSRSTDPLVVPANSIVFVESDLEFRLPRYIALRFNLQIRHVHRGLLLGTGPLVDPGYWGKLCIPLHNLTDANYEIPTNEGLIWVEFTKTTSDSSEGRITLTEGETDAQHWEIETFLMKAAHSLIPGRPSVGIKSSIPTVVAVATDEAKKATATSLSALHASQDAARSAEGAKDEARKSEGRFFRIAWLGFAVAAISLLGLWATFYSAVRNDISPLTIRTDQLKAELTRRLEKSEAEIEVLKRENQDLRQRQLAPSPPTGPLSPSSGAPPGR